MIIKKKPQSSMKGSPHTPQKKNAKKKTPLYIPRNFLYVDIGRIVGYALVREGRRDLSGEKSFAELVSRLKDGSTKIDVLGFFSETQGNRLTNRSLTVKQGRLIQLVESMNPNLKVYYVSESSAF